MSLGLLVPLGKKHRDLYVDAYTWRRKTHIHKVARVRILKIVLTVLTVA